ncbi:MAG: 3-oxoacyl-[acyl-carrier-protein] synthase III C-terminal domain-containing protein [Pseudomonadota bacterium]
MKIIGTGRYAPGAPLRASDCDVAYDHAEGTVARLTGVMSRHVCSQGDTQITMGTAAAEQAMASAGVTVQDIDLIISAAAVPYQPIPATSPAYQAALGITDGQVFAFDVNATCLSFVTALDVCAGMLARGPYRTALIISSEVASAALPWRTRPDIAGLFGDGAAAVVVTADEAPFHARFSTFASGYNICGIGAGGTRFNFEREAEAFAAHSLFDMDGKALFRLTTQVFNPFVSRLLDDVGWARDEVDLVVPHQASPKALQHMIRQCGFAPGAVVDISQTFGNQIAASIPFALDHACDRLRPGAKVLMLGTSAGVSFGGAALEWA